MTDRVYEAIISLLDAEYDELGENLLCAQNENTRLDRIIEKTQNSYVSQNTILIANKRLQAILRDRRTEIKDLQSQLSLLTSQSVSPSFEKSQSHLISSKSQNVESAPPLITNPFPIALIHSSLSPHQDNPLQTQPQEVVADKKSQIQLATIEQNLSSSINNTAKQNQTLTIPSIPVLQSNVVIPPIQLQGVVQPTYPHKKTTIKSKANTSIKTIDNISNNVINNTKTDEVINEKLEINVIGGANMLVDSKMVFGNENHSL
ncbi:hypothetical protein EIN_281970 [Entamoeba invadens IP1]|uniref:Uncharacterized protein n=1 Tax=Entamoeba invadens IP1 TaxID=370355 RepID=A0A0A1U028_ENTIV|nr:hypothetical protein EIN_281970 [Entamoeba invadens IP1]ELP85826.1 hypothetical protein EIN_281970 [Entamoeba invadens IP1]|eukprot:XP_004185172.1 hypothetical protein EIN_281970 [Entamoeba invadens IP1]